jgi:adenylylsulfate kinase
MARLRAAGAKWNCSMAISSRTNLSQGLGFSREDRDTNIRRIGFVAELLSRNGVIVVVAAISPYRDARGSEAQDPAVSWKSSSIAPSKCWPRDTKGLYKRALAGELGNFTGISDPYEPPLDPDPSWSIRIASRSRKAWIAKIWRELERRGLDRIRKHDRPPQPHRSLRRHFTPAELIAEAVRVGLTALAITDHDTFAGYDAAVPFAPAAGLELICGIELSTRYQGGSVHLLGYFPVQRPPSKELRAWLEFSAGSRRDRKSR